MKPWHYILLGVGLYWFFSRDERLDITSTNNLAYSGVNKVGRTLSNDSAWTLGGWIYDVTHKEYDANAPSYEP